VSDIIEVEQEEPRLDNDYPTQEQPESQKGKIPFIVWLLGIVAIFFYLHAIFYGKFSISVYLDAKDKKEKLLKEYNTLQENNQKLQKKHFEMIQLTPSEDAF